MLNKRFPSGITQCPIDRNKHRRRQKSEKQNEWLITRIKELEDKYEKQLLKHELEIEQEK